MYWFKFSTEINEGFMNDLFTGHSHEIRIFCSIMAEARAKSGKIDRLVTVRLSTISDINKPFMRKFSHYLARTLQKTASFIVLSDKILQVDLAKYSELIGLEELQIREDKIREDKIRVVDKTSIEVPNVCVSSSVKKPTGRKKTFTPTAKEEVLIEEICKTTNSLLGKKYLPKGKVFSSMVTRLLREGFTVKDFEYAVRWCRADWSDDPKMQRFIKFNTIFGPEKFPGYVENGMGDGLTGDYSLKAPEVKKGANGE